MDQDASSTRFELSHDTIARQVFDKASAEAQTRRKIEKYIRDRFAMYRERGSLLTRDDLDYIHPYLEAIRADREERAFIAESERAFRRKRNRLRVTVVGIIAVLAASTGVTASFGVSRPRARRASRTRANWPPGRRTHWTTASWISRPF